MWTLFISVWANLLIAEDTNGYASRPIIFLYGVFGVRGLTHNLVLLILSTIILNNRDKRLSDNWQIQKDKGSKVNKQNVCACVGKYNIIIIGYNHYNKSKQSKQCEPYQRMSWRYEWLYASWPIIFLYGVFGVRGLTHNLAWLILRIMMNNRDKR